MEWAVREWGPKGLRLQQIMKCNEITIVCTSLILVSDPSLQAPVNSVEPLAQ